MKKMPEEIKSIRTLEIQRLYHAFMGKPLNCMRVRELMSSKTRGEFEYFSNEIREDLLREFSTCGSGEGNPVNDVSRQQSQRAAVQDGFPKVDRFTR